MNDPLKKYLNNEHVSVKEMDSELFIYLLKEFRLQIFVVTLVTIFAFLCGYYLGYSGAVHQCKLFVEETFYNNFGGYEWIIPSSI